MKEIDLQILNLEIKEIMHNNFKIIDLCDILNLDISSIDTYLVEEKEDTTVIQINLKSKICEENEYTNVIEIELNCLDPIYISEYIIFSLLNGINTNKLIDAGYKNIVEDDTFGLLSNLYTLKYIMDSIYGYLSLTKLEVYFVEFHSIMSDYFKIEPRIINIIKTIYKYNVKINDITLNNIKNEIFDLKEKYYPKIKQRIINFAVLELKKSDNDIQNDLKNIFGDEIIDFIEEIFNYKCIEENIK